MYIGYLSVCMYIKIRYVIYNHVCTNKTQYITTL